MKKLYLLLIILCGCFSLCACKENKQSSKVDKPVYVATYYSSYRSSSEYFCTIYYGTSSLKYTKSINFTSGSPTKAAEANTINSWVEEYNIEIVSINENTILYRYK